MDDINILIDIFHNKISNKYNISIEEIKDIWNKNTVIENKGTGAGGANTNKNGIPYEKITDLKDEFTILEKNKFFSKIKFKNNEKVFIRTEQSNLFKYMKNHINSNITPAHGCKNPDECYIFNDTIFIIEKKFQQVSGSVCEKIQTPHFKKWQYERTFPNYNVIYMYCLSDWFRENCKSELEYLNYLNIPIFWGNCKNYKNKIIEFIINYN